MAIIKVRPIASGYGVYNGGRIGTIRLAAGVATFTATTRRMKGHRRARPVLLIGDELTAIGRVCRTIERQGQL